MRILLTGGTGQLGSALRGTLSALGEVVAPPRNALDLASADALVATVREIRPDLVINAAAYTAVDQAESEAAVAMQVNGIAPGILAVEARRLNAALIHYSTDYVFAGDRNAAYREDDAAAPLNVYGRTKLAGEHGVIAAGAAHLILRTGWVYASHGRNFLLTMRRLAREGKEIRVVDDQIGAPTFARDIAAATARVIAQSIADGRFQPDRFRVDGGLYHLTALGQTTWFGFAQAILAGTEAMGRLLPTTTRHYPTPARRPQYSVLDNGKFARQFGFQLPDWRVGVARCLQELNPP
jgi:dTDP-4-dehydrorhamnose reductase